MLREEINIKRRRKEKRKRVYKVIPYLKIYSRKENAIWMIYEHIQKARD